ncbi:aquaporin PIP2-2-like [Platysternon megacephalum]|uniref:phosphoserine transaminase n=1 Tax=Platysternon megacephalum TaxID=55544 RepID=A0A4D9DBN0_9SAUR|nr:aquaporin PIP2-2-like [Platysternon megacephalum]
MSVMEMSHRSKVFDDIIKTAEAKLRSVMGIPENYKVLFLQGGATQQFAMIPMNFMQGGTADYVVTGTWSKKAYQEAQKFGEPKEAGNGLDRDEAYIPRQDELTLNPDADYVHICENNTIAGTKWDYTPDTNGVPLINDMSSCILSEPVDVSKYAMIYAGAQKNMAPAGLTVAIIRDDFLKEVPASVPTMLNYNIQVKGESMHNTPPCWPIYVLMEVLTWIEGKGGLEAMKKLNEEKAAVLYDYLAESTLFKTQVDLKSKSLMNVCFNTGDAELDAAFAKEAADKGMPNLKGHRSVGGLRASIYNAFPIEGVEALVEFMREFEAKHAK